MAQCFAIFEGGGAKGLAHVGALKAAESRNLEFIGVAGASAGAIIAALVAAGFKADDLYCPDPVKRTTSLFAELDWIRLLEKDHWRSFQEFTREFASLPSSTGGLRMAWKAWRFKRKWMDFLRRSAKQKGFFSTNTFEAWLNDKLTERLELKGGDVTFSSLYKKSHKFLKVVAVDIVEQKLVTYSHLNENKDLPVAKAVAASISIPFFFAPTGIATRLMVDGGLMSNFPAWLFDAERAAYPPFTRTYGFTLVDAGPPSPWRPGLFNSIIDYAGLVVQAGVFGGQMLLNEGIEFFEVVPVKTSFGVLDFELNDKQKNDLYKDGLKSASSYFAGHGVADDIAVTVALKVLSDELRTLIKLLPEFCLRANVALPVSKDYLRVAYSHNMASDVDDRLRLEQGQTGTGDALKLKKPVYTDLRQIRRDDRTMRGLSKYEAALVRKDLVSLFSVPIFAAEYDWEQPADVRAQPTAVLGFDCNEDILACFKRSDVTAFFEQSSILLGRLLRGEPLVEELKVTSISPKNLAESSELLEPTGTTGNLMQQRPDPTMFDNDFGKGLVRLAKKVDEGIKQYGANGIQFR